MRDKLAAKLSRHWHKMFVGGHVAYFGTAAIEGNTFGALMAAMIVVGAILHLGE